MAVSGDLSEEMLDEASVKLLRVLDTRTAFHVDQLATKAQLPVQATLRKLLELEVKGLCIQRPGKYFLRR